MSIHSILFVMIFLSGCTFTKVGDETKMKGPIEIISDAFKDAVEATKEAVDTTEEAIKDTESDTDKESDSIK